MGLLRAVSEADEGAISAAASFVAGSFNALRYLIRVGGAWRMLPNDLPPWAAVQQQAQRWLRAVCFEAMAHDLRLLLRLGQQREGVPSAVVLDSRTLQSTPESGASAGFDGHKNRKGSKVHAAVDTWGHLLALKVTAANELDRAQVGELAAALQEVPGQNVQAAFVDQGYTGQQPAQQTGLRPKVIKHHQAKRGIVLLPRRWVVERSFALGCSLPPIGSRLRTTGPHLSRLSLVGFCHPHASLTFH